MPCAEKNSRLTVAPSGQKSLIGHRSWHLPDHRLQGRRLFGEIPCIFVVIDITSSHQAVAAYPASPGIYPAHFDASDKPQQSVRSGPQY